MSRLTEERRAEIAALLVPPDPTGQEDQLCAICDQIVDVSNGCDWDDGDICLECEALLAAKTRAATKELLAEVEELRAERDEARRHVVTLLASCKSRDAGGSGRQIAEDVAAMAAAQWASGTARAQGSGT